MDTIVEELWDQGWSVTPNFLSPELTRRLAEECRGAWGDGTFRRAGVGVGPNRIVDDNTRRDHVLWMDEAALTDTQRLYWEQLEQLRLGINRSLTLGLYSFEGHFAVYPPGAFYKKHLDQFRAVRYRQVSCVLYLNDGWKPADRGQLRLYLSETGEGDYVDVLPEGGTFAVFLSGRFYHEVLPANRERMSLTGWFRTRE